MGIVYLVDVNVLCEGTKLRPVLSVVEWLTERTQEIAVNPVILGELKFGILTMPAGRRRDQFVAWAEAGVDCLPVIPIDAGTAEIWAVLCAELRRKGRSMPVKDSLIAATALQHGLTVATRNEEDYRYTGVPLVNPFAS